MNIVFYYTSYLGEVYIADIQASRTHNVGLTLKRTMIFKYEVQFA